MIYVDRSGEILHLHPSIHHKTGMISKFGVALDIKQLTQVPTVVHVVIPQVMVDLEPTNWEANLTEELLPDATLLDKYENLFQNNNLCKTLQIIHNAYFTVQIVNIEVQLTAAHAGFMEFRICANPGNNAGESQACFNQNLLQRSDGGGSRIPVDGPRTYVQGYRLPANLRCARCVVQWNYRAGNNVKSTFIS